LKVDIWFCSLLLNNFTSVLTHEKFDNADPCC